MKRVLQVLLILLVPFTKNVLADGMVHCYNCSSNITGECGDGLKNDPTPVILCDSACYKQTISRTPYEDLVVRGCIHKMSGLCKNPIWRECFICTEDFCNHATTSTLSSYCIILLSSVYIIYSRLFYY